MKRINFLIILLILAQQIDAQKTEEELFLASMHKHITSEKLFGYVVQLSDSSLRGRLAGSADMAKAVEIIKGYYSEWGLSPANGNTYIQEYPHPCVEIQEGSTIEVLFPVKSGKKETVWVAKQYPWADGWYAGNASGNGDVTAEVVYAGFGVSAPELGYDDYAGIDVKGKIVLIEGETPNKSRSADSIRLWYNHTLHQTKIANAIKHGAVGMLYKWVPGPNALYDPDFVYAHVSEDVVNDIFLGTGRTYKETVNSIYTKIKPSSFATGKKARIKMISTYNPDATGKNVVGFIKGSDPVLANEYIIISAHLDHLGMIPYHIAGANDNNASTAALLGVAEALAKSEIKPKRSVVFLTLDGEEAGLTGSTYYTKNPLFPKEKTAAILNLEGMGIGSGLRAAYAYTFPGFRDYLNKANDSYVHRNLRMGETQFLPRPRTDGAVFMKAGYPCADLRGSGGGYYHHPKDSPEYIVPRTLLSSTEWLYWTTILLANDTELNLKVAR